MTSDFHFTLLGVCVSEMSSINDRQGVDRWIRTNRLDSRNFC